MRIPLGLGVIFLLAAFPGPARTQLPPPKPPASGLSGVIVDSLNEPVQYAVVTIADVNIGTTADEDGKFRISGIVSGRTAFRVRRVGFEPIHFEIELPDSASVEVKITMRASPHTVAPVAISGVREPLKLVGFYERLAQGQGHFITPEYLDRTRPSRSSDALINIPDVVVDRRGNRSRIMTSNQRCEYSLFIDGIQAGEPGSRVRTTSPDDLVSASDLYAIEVFPRNRGVPARYLGMNHEDGCGTILMWTKSMIAR